MMNKENINKLNNLLSQLDDVREELAKVNALRKRERLIEKTIKAMLLEHDEVSFINSEWQVTINKTIKGKITEEKVIEIIDLYDTNQLESLCLDDFLVPKESVSMKIKKIKKEVE